MSRRAGPLADREIPVLEGSAAFEWVATRPRELSDDCRAGARAIVERVRREGDPALLALTRELDGVTPASLRVPRAVLREALESLPADRRRAVEEARRHIEAFHAAQRRTEAPVEPAPGVRTWREFRPIRRVGLYVPGGRARYPSSLLMTAVPARLAGCREIAVCSPPGPDGRPPAAVRAAAALLGIGELYAVGGAQAIAALAYGTESVPPVEKIFGPGGARVAAAKECVASRAAVDLPAGPSEVLVWADASAPPAWIAAELLAQAEHGPDSLCAAILPAPEAAGEVRREVARQLSALPTREAAAASLARGALLIPRNEAEAREWIETLAPEHLVLMVEDPRAAAARIASAGSVFLGPFSPVAAGDYATGTNHVLPTGRRARAEDGLSLDDFGRWVTFQELTSEGLARLAPTVETLAEWEGLPAHAAATRIRQAGVGEPSHPPTAPPRARPAAPAAPAEENAASRTAGVSRFTADGQPARSLLRPHLSGVPPYVTARSGQADGIRLDANENALGTLVPELDPELHRYPDPGAPALRERLAAFLDVSAEALWLGHGSDEVIDLLVRATTAPGETVAIASPTYGVYESRVRLHGARLRPLPLDAAFDLDLDAALAATVGARLLLFCSPNNPTGNSLSRDRILALAERARCAVAVDEAYVEFSRQPSLAPLAAAEIPNLVVIRTLSKAWGMAGARVGYLVAHPDLTALLSRAGLPYPLSRLAVRAALGSLAREEEMRARADRIVAERGRLRGRLQALGLRVLPSEANFLLFFVERPARVQADLAHRFGLLVRDRSDLPRLEGALRVTVGTPEENDRFLEGLRATLAAEGPGARRRAARDSPADAGREPRTPDAAAGQAPEPRVSPAGRPTTVGRPGRRAELCRETRETRVRVAVDRDGTGETRIATGIPFFDHMLETLARHALLDLEIEARGDLAVDEHHTVEDVGIVLGQAISRALGERRGIRRYGFLLPMDDSLARVAIDLGGRPYVVFRAAFSRERVGGLPTELVEEFVRALATHLGANVHVSLEYGRNDHHKVEAIFKALGRSLRAALERDPRLEDRVPSTKGVL
ncbi:MAG: histidinol dehydrogenase [Gemmatimonadota bacterium]